MKKLVFLILSLICVQEVVIGCSCSNVPSSFMEHIRADHIIFSATVLKQIRFQNQDKVLMSYHGVTQLKVDKWYQNKMISDTIYYANGSGASCDYSMEGLEKGQRILLKTIKASLDNLSFPFYKNLDQQLVQAINYYNNKPIVAYGICDVSFLFFEQNYICGNITKNYVKRRTKLYYWVNNKNKKLGSILSEYYQKNPKYQKWNTKKFDTRMRQKWHSFSHRRL